MQLAATVNGVQPNGRVREDGPKPRCCGPKPRFMACSQGGEMARSQGEEDGAKPSRCGSEPRLDGSKPKGAYVWLEAKGGKMARSQVVVAWSQGCMARSQGGGQGVIACS